MHRTELRQVLSFDRTNNCKRAGYWYRTLCSSALRLILCPRRCGVVALRCAAHDRQRQPGTVAALQALALLLLALQPPLLPFPDVMARGCKARSSKASACMGEMLLHQAEQGRRRGDVTRVEAVGETCQAGPNPRPPFGVRVHPRWWRMYCDTATALASNASRCKPDVRWPTLVGVGRRTSGITWGKPL